MFEKHIKLILQKVYKILDNINFILAMLIMMNSPDRFCDENSKYYRYAHSLSQERLEKIYTDLKSYSDKNITFNTIRKKYPDRPVEFQYLEYARLTLPNYSNNATMRLSFCMDQTIDIIIEGISNDTTPLIKLVWGELTRKEEILWEKK